MINPEQVKNTPFEYSHLLSKMKRILIATRIWEGKEEKKLILYSVTEFDLDNSEIFNQIKADYELIRKTLRENGFSSLSSKLGVYIQPRTKGKGHGSTSRAFYGRKELLKRILAIK